MNKVKKNKKDISNKLTKLSKRKGQMGIFTVKEAKKFKISPQLISHYYKKKQLKKLSHGVYAFKDQLGFDFYSILKEKIICVPQGIIGLESALKVYDLTDINPPEIQLIVPVSNVPKKKLKDVKLYRMKKDIYKKYITIIEGIPVTSIERTIVDLLRFGYSVSFILNILKECKKKKINVHLGKIKKIASKYSAKGKVSQLLEAV